MPETSPETSPEPARTCDTCASCCTWLGIAKLKKHAGQTCTNLKNGDPRKRCGVYSTRPEACQVYLCAWRIGLFPEDLRPDLSGFIVNAYPPDIFVIQMFDRNRAGSIKDGKLHDALQRLFASGNITDLRVIDTQKTQVLHFLNGEIFEGKLLKQLEYEDLRFTHEGNAIGRYEIKPKEEQS